MCVCVYVSVWCIHVHVVQVAKIRLTHVHVTQEQQVRQEQEINVLERQLEEAKFRHENHVRSMKTQFLQEKRAYEAEMALRVRTMTQRASQVYIYTYTHVEQVQHIECSNALVITIYHCVS